MTFMSEVPDWSGLRSVVGGAEFVPSAVARMVHATTAEDASSAYWELDNRVVVQGQLFEAAVWAVRAVCAAICEGEPTVFGLGRALDLLVEIAVGEPDESELALGNADLGILCREEIGQHLRCFRGFAASEDDRTLLAVLDLLDIVEVDRKELREVAQTILLRNVGSAVEARARELAGGS